MKETNNVLSLSIQENAFVDRGDGVIEFPNGLVITDDTEQRNGTRYDINTMDIAEYKGQLTADHSSSIKDVIGKVFGLRKAGNKVTLNKIQYAIKENALAKYTYDMMKAKYITDFSIETFGPWPDDEGIYRNSKLIGLSVVVVGNNRSAFTNDAMKKVAYNSVKGAKEEGLDTEYIENNILCYNDNENIKNSKPKVMYKTVKNSRDFSVMVMYKNAKGDEVEKELPPGETVDVSEDQVEAVENMIKTATAPQPDVAEIVKNAIAPFTAKIEDLEKKMFDNSVEEPKFKKAVAPMVQKNKFESTDWKERHALQINHAWDMLKNRSMEASQKLSEINEFHIEKLKEASIVSNSVTLGDFGNFVISPELLSEIEGHRSNFAPFVNALDYRETLSLQMAWLKRSGDINMQEVEMCDDGADGNLKPISDYSANISQANLHELAAVTPVCDSTTRFLAVDLLGDVAQGYRTDYDRKRAQLAIVRFQQAVNSTGNTITYGTTSNASALEAFINTWSQAAEEVMNGTFIFNLSTYGELVRRLVGAGVSGPLSGVFTTGDQPMILGRPYIVVPNELLPTLNTAGTKSFTVEGVSVTINQAVFYADLSTFTGRTSGGLNFDLSTEAAYEEGGSVKSAFQRNELVLRGSFFRNGAVRDEDKVVGLGAPGVS